ncbi:methyltransferase family protein [Pararhodonellum marinum]|uniref:methyltransferase family protein n=1 Tax=Pararhodonellum marinum TaxID=2755358 RepID=UPI00188FDEFE|nr:isoprenylcysteine carboxylmethyltransferase family protein [Pararhodonellum marinum]
MPYLFLLIAWFVFYFKHTFFARLNIKRKFQGWMGKHYKWYRLGYSFVSTILFFGIIAYGASLPSEFLLRQNQQLTYIGFLVAGIGTIVIVKSLRYFDTFRFMGLPPYDDLKQKETLVVSGIYKTVRHPLYLGLVLIFLGFFLYSPTWVSLLHFLSLIIYLPFGIYYEEQKLMVIFGKYYEAYRKAVPSIIPFWPV